MQVFSSSNSTSSHSCSRSNNNSRNSNISSNKIYTRPNIRYHLLHRHNITMKDNCQVVTWAERHHNLNNLRASKR